MLAVAVPAPAANPARRVAVTFDDLPAVAVVGDGIDAWRSLNARLLEAIARHRVQGRGYSFVPLEEALADAAYRSKDTWTGVEGITWLHRWAFSTGHRETILPDEPRTPEFVMRESGIAAE